METRDAAKRWATTWERAWPLKDAEAIAALYVEDAVYRSHPFRDPVPGGARPYVDEQFAMETAIECRFGEPIVDRDRAAIEWWASWIEEERELTLAGTSILRFDDSGRVLRQLDYWVEGEGRIAPFQGWRD